MSGASEIFALADELADSASEVLPQVRDAFQSSAEKVRDGWRDGVRSTSTKYLPHLPSAITYETKVSASGLTADIGPESGRKQGRIGRGEELGSVNQPPHLHGLTAFTAEEGELEREAATRLEQVIP